MTKVQPKAGFHTGGGGGNPSGITSDYIIPVLAAGKDVTIVAADTTAGLYDACVAAANYQNSTSVLCWRRTDQRKNGGFDFDALANDLMVSPEENAERHWNALQPQMPPELLPYKSQVEIIVLNEIRGKQTNEPIYQNLHIGEYLGRFALHYRTLTDWRLLFFGFAAGEPDTDVWQQPSMLKLLRLCAERPYDAGIALHEYSYNVNDILDSYPYLVGRYKFLHNICDDNAIPRPRIVISEWGWTLDDAPEPGKAIADIDAVFAEYAKHPNIAGGALWWLGPGFGGIADKVQKIIKPLGDHIIATDYDVEIEQPQPPNGGGTMTAEYNINWELPRSKPESVVKVRLAAQGKTGGVWGNLPGGVVSLDLPEGTERVVISQLVEETEPGNPNPPSVVTLPKGALGVDVSAHQGQFAWDTAVMNGVQFAIVRSSNGLGSSSTDANGQDLQLKRNAAELTRLGIPWAIYHFLQPGQSIQQQAALVNGILAELDIDGTFPIPGMINGRMLPAVFVDVEDGMITTSQVKTFMDALTMTAGIYTAKGVWDGISAGENVWWSDVFLWCAAYGANDGKLPNWTSPSLPRGWYGIDIWQYTSLGGHEVGMASDNLDLNSAGPYAPNITQPPIPPPTNTIDLLDYMIGTDKQQHTLQYTWGGGGTETVQTRHETGGNWKIVKGNGGNYEQLYYDANWIYRAEDTSESAERFYTQSTNGILGAAWVKRRMAVGETVYTSKTVQHYLKAGCVPQNGGLVTDKLTLTAVYPSYTFKSGLTLPDVIRLEWAAGEGYLFAKGYGLVGFEFSGGESYISELALNGRADLPIARPSCVDLSGRFYV